MSLPSVLIDAEAKTGFGGAVYLLLLGRLNSLYNTLVPALMESYGWWIRSFVTLYIVLVGYGIMTGKIGKDKMIELGISALLIVLLHTAIMETNTYNKVIAEPLLKIPKDVGGFFVSEALKNSPLKSYIRGKAIVGIFQRMDEMFAKMLNVGFKMKPTGYVLTNAITYIEMYLQIGLISFCFMLVYFAFMALIIMAYFCLYVYLMVGGIFLFLAAFQQTRHLFWAWLKGAVNYAVLIMLLCLVMGVCLSGVDQSIDDMANLKNYKFYFSYEFIYTLIWLVITFVLMLKVPDIASSLTGGSAGSTTMIADSAGKAGALLGAGAGALAMKGKGAAIKGGKTALEKLRSIRGK